jgi:hypothetical protein
MIINESSGNDREAADQGIYRYRVVVAAAAAARVHSSYRKTLVTMMQMTMELGKSMTSILR